MFIIKLESAVICRLFVVYAIQQAVKIYNYA